MKFFRGTTITSGETLGIISEGTEIDFCVGRSNSDLYYLSSTIDELRISEISRSAEWIKTSYNTMNDLSSFFSVGHEESVL